LPSGSLPSGPLPSGLLPFEARCERAARAVPADFAVPSASEDGAPAASASDWPGSASISEQPRGKSSARGVVPPLLDPGRLAAQVAHVVELGAADPATGDDLDLVDRRAVHREGALHAHAVADLAHGEGLPEAAALAPDHEALE